MPSRFFSRYSHLKKVHSLQLSLEKVHTRSQTVTPSDEEVTCEIRRGFESSDQAELTYPPKSMVLSQKIVWRSCQS